mmetsp:Transcript_80341/g.236365  ORF Transcript_80341/g.236365 Transcript_80341/m.236365 type:complete len:548 (-) Transcript_80341:69-1712(-)
MADVAPEALVQEQRTSDGRRLLQSECLDGGAQAPMDDEDVHALEEDTEVGLLGLEEAALLLQRLGFRCKVSWDRVLVPLPHINEPQVEGAVFDHLGGAPQHRLPVNRHAAERHDSQLRTGVARTLDEVLQGLWERAAPAAPLAQEDEVRAADAVPPVRGSLESTRTHRNHDWLIALLHNRPSVSWVQAEPIAHGVDVVAREGVLLREGLPERKRVLTGEHALLEAVHEADAVRLDRLHGRPCGVGAGNEAGLEDEADRGYLVKLVGHQRDARQRHAVDQHVYLRALVLEALQMLHDHGAAVEELGLRVREHHHLHELALLVRRPLAQGAVHARLRVAAHVQEADLALRQARRVRQHEALPAELRADGDPPAPLLGHAPREGDEGLHVAPGAARDHDDVARAGGLPLLGRRGPGRGQALRVQRDGDRAGPVGPLGAEHGVAHAVVHQELRRAVGDRRDEVRDGDGHLADELRPDHVLVVHGELHLRDRRIPRIGGVEAVLGVPDRVLAVVDLAGLCRCQDGSMRGHLNCDVGITFTGAVPVRNLYRFK